ncbi:Stp1/IreP family PP2C-type Ser/Thr phosphatase [candidate division KSB1 bacterium]|nr:Stp1/IreP family PP2C-type Ser/Thr phosphatase [candidate division KSB1 bacterium]
MKIIFSAATDVGQKRERNEDYFTVVPEHNLAVLCDGMGGLNAGDVASRATVRIVSNVFKKHLERKIAPVYVDINTTLPNEAKYIVGAIRLANRHLTNITPVKGGARQQMGTTIEVAYFAGNNLFIGHVGDSRIYRLRNQTLEQLTDDHSWVNELLQDKEITEAEAENFHARNVITRALGVKPTVKIDILISEVQPGDKYLLCSDGLTGPVSDELIKQELVRCGNDIQSVTRQLITAANNNGGPDNITLAIAHVVSVSNQTYKLSRVSQTIPEETPGIISDANKLLHDIYGKRQKRPLWSVMAAFVILVIIITSFMLWKGKPAPTSISETNHQPPVVEQTLPVETTTELPQHEEQAFGTLHIVIWSVENKQADVFLDGKPLGKALNIYNEGIKVTPGRHNLVLKLNSLEIYNNTFTISASGKKTVEID